MRSARDFPPHARVLRDVRRFVRESLVESTDPMDAVLVASELAANVVLHAETDFTVAVVVGDVVRLEVSDGSSILPAVEELAEDSRGLRLVEAASERWGVELTATGKTIWVELPLAPPQSRFLANER